jgi:hypothetical protein
MSMPTTAFRIPSAEFAYALDRECKQHPDNKELQRLGKAFWNNIREAGSLHAMAIGCFHEALGGQGALMLTIEA